MILGEEEADIPTYFNDDEFRKRKKEWLFAALDYFVQLYIIFVIKKPEIRKNPYFGTITFLPRCHPNWPFRSAFHVQTYALPFYGCSTRRLLLTQKLRVRSPSQVHSFFGLYRNSTACGSLWRAFEKVLLLFIGLLNFTYNITFFEKSQGFKRKNKFYL